MTEQIWHSPEGTDLYHITWHPEKRPKAVIAFVHGHGDHCRRYDEWFSGFVMAGMAVVSFDYRGHGRSSGKRGTIDSFSDLTRDLSFLVDQARASFPELPLILYGHSMGATIVLNHLQAGKDLPGLAIVTSPWLKLRNPPGKIYRLLIRLANIIAPRFTMKTGLHSSDFSSVDGFSEKREKDTYVHNRISARLFMEVQRMAGQIESSGKKITVPTLLMHGNGDRVTDGEADRAVAEKSPETITFREWNKTGHQLHNSENSQEIRDYIIEWINQQL